MERKLFPAELEIKRQGTITIGTTREIEDGIIVRYPLDPEGIFDGGGAGRCTGETFSERAPKVTATI
jgi:hypothetical protein